ncbi:MAG: ApaG domain, partial [Burkholderiaceae bacterium]|nr:ApaG domain [Burkholderiaceae bacterium]
MAKYEFSVSAVPHYLPEQSAPEANRYVFAYTVTIRNTGEVAAQLISRHWIITDGEGRVQEVRG